MDRRRESQPSQAGGTGGEADHTRRKARGWLYAGGVLAVVFVALLVVGADLRRLRSRSIPDREARLPTDTALTRWRSNMYNRVRHLEKKYQGYRGRDREYTHRQSEIAHDADSAFDAVYQELFAFDSIDANRQRIRRARRIKRMFSDLKKPVYKFARSIFVADSLRNASGESGTLPPP